MSALKTQNRFLSFLIAGLVLLSAFSFPSFSQANDQAQTSQYEAQAQEFMGSPAAQNFAKGNYQEALQGFDQMLQARPDDVLALRFKALTLSKLGRKQDAITAFSEALRRAPDNAALHFYLAETHLQTGNIEGARKEYRWVIENDETLYRYRAQQGLLQTRGQAGPAKKRKPWTLNFTQGVAYDTNAPYTTRDASLRQPGDRNSVRFDTLLTGTYRLFKKGGWIFVADGLYAQSLYTDFVRLQTYTPGAGLSALYAFTLFDKPAFFTIREGLTQTYLRNRFYVFSDSVSPSFVFNFYKKLKTVISHRWSYNEYDNFGPSSTNRDGYGNITSLANTWYFNDLRTQYVSFTYDYEHQGTRGVDYIKNAHGFRFDLHSPLIEKVEGEFTFRFKNSDYPKFSAGPPSRHDDLYSITTTLSRPLNSYLTLSAAHSFERVNGRNNLYEYWKNVFLVELSLRY